VTEAFFKAISHDINHVLLAKAFKEGQFTTAMMLSSTLQISVNTQVCAICLEELLRGAVNCIDRRFAWFALPPEKEVCWKRHMQHPGRGLGPVACFPLQTCSHSAAILWRLCAALLSSIAVRLS
jgi:hypothetical protein